MQKAVLLLDLLRITQAMNGSYSHNGDLAIDISKMTALSMPWDGTVKRIYVNCNAVWVQSIEKVKYPDGTEDYQCMLAIHDNDVSNLKVGMVLKQGTPYYHPGVKGQVTGSHIHLAVGKGKFTGNGWYKNSKGSWCINNQYDIVKALFLKKDTKLDLSTKISYDWTITDSLTVEETKPSTNTTQYYKKPNYIGVSITSALKKINVDSSYNNRSKIAKVNGIKDFKGTGHQNLEMLKLLLAGKLIKP